MLVILVNDEWCTPKLALQLSPLKPLTYFQFNSKLIKILSIILNIPLVVSSDKIYNDILLAFLFSKNAYAYGEK